MPPSLIYLDHAATTPVRDEVFEAMRPFFGTHFGNPSSTHRWGRQARAALDEARERVRTQVSNVASSDVDTLRKAARSALGKFVSERTRRRPMIVPIVMEV